MPSLPSWRRSMFLAALAVAVSLPLAVSHAAGPISSEAAAGDEAFASPLALLAQAAQQAPAAKLSTSLAALDKSAAAATPTYLVVYSAAAVDLSAHGQVLRSWSWPAGERVTLVKAPATAAAGIAAVPGVARVSSGDPGMVRPPVWNQDPDLTTPSYEPLSGRDLAAVQRRAHDAPSWREVQRRQAERVEVDRMARAAGRPSGAIRPTGWFDVGYGHSTQEAWDLGYKGEGVTVAVLDSPVDFGHQDMQGAWAVYPDGHPDAGWAYALDPYSAYLYSIEVADPDAPRYSEEAASGFIGVYQSSDVAEDTTGAAPVYTACLQGLTATINPQTGALSNPYLADEDCEFKVPESMSGEVYYGHHPDASLFVLGARPDQDGEFAGVLLADPNEAGVYDTVVVDLNNNRDFTDDKPMTKDDPVSYRDLDADGIADLSGGILYYIADGERPVPGAWTYEDAADPLPVPEAATMVGIFSDSAVNVAGGHGTMCGSNVSSQGRLGVPPGVNFGYRNDENNPYLNAAGQPESVNPGMAPRAGLVSVGDVYRGGDLIFEAAWRYAVMGGRVDREDDDPQIASNSYGFSNEDADHWDLNSRFIDYYIRENNPNLSFLVAAGNGGPGYGTITAPKPATGMGISASTQWGTLGWDSIYEVSQIIYGDVTNWSDRGPAADGGLGVHVASDGAFDVGGVPINAVTLNQNRPEAQRSGAFANTMFGGTSQATPMAAGNLALVYQAFKQANDRWPTYAEARSLFMAGARFNGYDVVASGAGGVDTGNAVRLASGMYGVRADPPFWAAGGYHGQSYASFANVVMPGESAERTVTLKNSGEAPVEASLHGQTLVRVDSVEEDFRSADRSLESQYNIQAADYLRLIDKTKIPAGTDLMVVRMVQPYDQFDMNNNFALDTADNNWRLMLYQHTDWNDDGKLWDDVNGDGIVQKTAVQPLKTVGLDSNLVAVDYAQSEIEEGEYNKFDMAYSASNSMLISVHHPLERWKNGIYIALFHRQSGCNYTTGTCTGMRPESVPQSDLKIRLDFYKYQDWPWLSLSEETVTVPAGGEATVEATLAVPSDAAAGFYEGAVFADYGRMAGDEQFPAGGGWEPADMRLTIPVTLNVAADYDWQGSLTLGGDDGRDADAMYDNGSVRGSVDWQWRPETGDWRFYFADATKPDAGNYWVARTTWDNTLAGKADINTALYGLESDGEMDGDYYGPGTMALRGASPSGYLGAGRWRFQTSSDEDEDWVSGAAGEGLHEVMLHHVLASGVDVDMPFETLLSSIRVTPSPLVVYGEACTDVTVVSQIPLPGFAAVSAGLTEPVNLMDEAIEQDDPNDPTSASFKRVLDIPSQIVKFQVTVDGQDGDDLDLFVLRDIDDNGIFTYPTEVVGNSTSPTADEAVTLPAPQPAGKYAVWVTGWSVPAGTSTFDYTEELIYGDDLTLENVPDEVEAGQPYTFQVCPDAAERAGSGGAVEWHHGPRAGGGARADHGGRDVAAGGASTGHLPALRGAGARAASCA